MLKDKIILITGSSRGIGAATARLAKQYGAAVILHGRTESEELKQLAKELNAEYIFCDVGDQKEVLAQVSKALVKVGRIDALINCAGSVKRKAFLEMTEEDWISDYKVNLLGTAYFCQAVIPVMQKNKYGRIVNISSIRGETATASNRSIAYSASKAGVINLTSALAKDFAPEILVNAVAPGFIATEMSKIWDDKTWKQVESALLKRAGKPEDIAETLLFLASDKNTFMTGQTILVDGGYTISEK